MSCCGRICVEAAQIRARSEPPLRTLSGHFGPFGKDAERKQQVTRRYGSGLVFQASQSSNDRSVSLGTWLRANFSNTIGRNRRVLSHQSRAQSGLFRWPRRSSVTCGSGLAPTGGGSNSRPRTKDLRYIVGASWTCQQHEAWTTIHRRSTSRELQYSLDVKYVSGAPRTMELRMLLSGGPIHAKRKQASPNDGS